VSTLAAACAALVGEGATPMPWLAPYLPLGRRVALEVMAGRTVAQALNAAVPGSTERGQRWRFVNQGELPGGEAYEAFIARTGCVPTRDNAHDLFNGLVWLRFGALKERLNALHAQAIEHAGVGGTRGAVRDALTLFDENAALLQAPAVLVEALRRRDWQALFVEHRATWQCATLVLVGHALLEKLLMPRKPITAHVRVLPPAQSPDGMSPDALPPDLLSPHWLAARPHMPLPVLGVPGWWSANEERNFYADESVFRPARPIGEGSWPAAGVGRALNPIDRP
jgi:hypothetical protein